MPSLKKKIAAKMKQSTLYALATVTEAGTPWVRYVTPFPDEKLIIWMAIAVVLTYGISKGLELFAEWRLDSALKKVRAEKPVSLEDAKYGSIEISDQGVTIRDSKSGVTEIPWGAVTRLTAFKRDIYTVDLICLALSYDQMGREVYLEVSEEMVGFKNLIEGLPDRFSLRDNDWWIKVAFPAFVQTMMILWEKEPPTTCG